MIIIRARVTAPVFATVQSVQSKAPGLDGPVQNNSWTELDWWVQSSPRPSDRTGLQSGLNQNSYNYFPIKWTEHPGVSLMWIRKLHFQPQSLHLISVKQLKNLGYDIAIEIFQLNTRLSLIVTGILSNHYTAGYPIMDYALPFKN